MNLTFVSEAFMQAIAWSLLHAIWQCGLIAFLLWAGLRLLRHSSAQLQYGISLLALIACVCWTGVSFWQEYQSLSTIYSIDIAVQSIALDVEDIIGISEVMQNNDFQYMWLQVKLALSPYLSWFFYIWVLGITVLGIRLISGVGYLHHMIREATDPIEEKWIALITQLSRQMGIHQSVSLKISNQISEPIVIGYLKPVILVPLGLFCGLSPIQVEAIFIHELAHIRRADYWVNIFQNLVETLLFFHPAIWWISGQVRKTRENCCDDWVIAIGSDPTIYAKTLLDIHSFNHLPKTHLAMSATGKKGHLTQRIHRLFQQSSERTNAFQRSIWAVLLLFIGSMSLAFQLNKPMEQPPFSEQDPIETVVTKDSPKLSLEKVETAREFYEQIPELVHDSEVIQAQKLAPTTENPFQVSKLNPEIKIKPISIYSENKIKLPTLVNLDTPFQKSFSPMSFDPVYSSDFHLVYNEFQKIRFDLQNPDGYLDPDFLLQQAPLNIETITAKQDTPRKKITIRHNETSKSKQPFFILDGEELGFDSPVEDIDPSTIESIDVLKGESAKELYGENGRNGVIRIWTKGTKKKKKDYEKEFKIEKTLKDKEKIKQKEKPKEKLKPTNEYEANEEEPKIDFQSLSNSDTQYFIDGVPIEVLGINKDEIESVIPVEEIATVDVKGEALNSQGFKTPNSAIFIVTKDQRYAVRRLGQSQSIESLEFNVYPNPTDDFITVELMPLSDANLKVFVINAQGQLVKELMNEKVAGRQARKIQWSVNGQASGTYYIHVIKDGKSFSKAFSVE